jgi:hypothetical protein
MRVGGNRGNALAAIDHLIASGAVEVERRGNAHQVRLAPASDAPGASETPP